MRPDGIVQSRQICADQTLGSADFPNSRVLARFEGGERRTAERDGKFFVITDESTMAGLLSEEDAEGIDFVKVLEFDTNAGGTSTSRCEGGTREPGEEANPEDTKLGLTCFAPGMPYRFQPGLDAPPVSERNRIPRQLASALWPDLSRARI